MPINYQQAVEQIRQMGGQARQRHERLLALRDQARLLLTEYAGQGAALNELVERGVKLNPRLRCAMAGADRLDATLPAPQEEQAYVLLAADGSQINPDRHSAVEFVAINVGAIRFHPAEAPWEMIVTSLRFGEDSYIDKRPMSDGDVAIWRDLEERKMLFELAQADQKSGQAVVTLTDGPLQLFGLEQESRFFKEQLERYLAVLRAMAGIGISAAGFVDKPRSDYLVALLELAQLHKDNHLSQAGKERPLWPVRDVDLLMEILQPGQRSAVFELRTPDPQGFIEELALHFFYINIGRPGHAHLARVEIPRWVAESEAQLGLLHRALLTQSAQLGARPFPYILHRAHEVAVVHPDEIDQIESMIQAELRRQGVEPGEQSYKQSAKDLPGRTRMK